MACPRASVAAILSRASGTRLLNYEGAYFGGQGVLQ